MPFACFLSQEEPKRVSKALSDLAWVEACKKKLLQFKLQNVCFFVDLPKGHRAISTKLVYRNKKDERGIVIRNKARLVAQGHTQEEGIDYDEVFAPVARIEAIRIFLAYASYMGFTVYQMEVKSAFLYGQIEESTQSLVQQRKKGIFISQDKYVHEILKKFNYTDVKSASTPTDLERPLVKDSDADDVDEHLYRSMIGSLMYLTASRPDIMFAVCACARFQESTTGGVVNVKGNRLILVQCKKQLGLPLLQLKLRQEVALFPNMLADPTPSASPSNSISSPEPTPSQPSPTQPSPIQPSPTQLSPTQPGSEYHPPTPHDSPLHPFTT
ncbi:putative ribonuclease H-like domain-containing protein [Tanacetum coccineum]|uniref:Ribonuclease H-like domain-containing protein n=1 Tax=Tanacetum coccineum TaxID=301880 RepID=A0ABQ5AHM6_9ASTR